MGRQRGRFQLSAALLAGVIVATGAGGQREQARAVVAGRVVDGASGRAVASATVTIRDSPARLPGQPPFSLDVDTGPDGRFRFIIDRAVSGARVSVTKSGYLPGYLGTLGPADLAGAQPFDVTPGRDATGLVIEMWPEATIAGVVTDRNGDPMAGAPMVLYQRVFAGDWTLRSVPIRNVRTDDRGSFRIERLRPGEYRLGVRLPATAANEARQPLYFGGSYLSASAAPIVLSAGDEFRADIRAGESTGLASLRGQIVGAASTGGMTVRIIPIGLDGLPSLWDQLTIRADASGGFHAGGLPPGRYRVSVWAFPTGESLLALDTTLTGWVTYFQPPPGAAIPRLPDAPTWVANEDVTLEANEQREVRLTLVRGATFSGRVVFEGPTPAPEILAASSVAVVPADARPLGPVPQSGLAPDGRFKSVGLPPGRYVLGLRPAQASLVTWFARSIEVNGVEALGDAIELSGSDITGIVVTATDKASGIAGVVLDPQGRPTSRARAIVFPQDPRERRHQYAEPAPKRVRQVVLDRTGAFDVQMPPGKYYVAAVTSLSPTWMTPEELDRLVPFAEPVSVNAGERPRVVVRASTRRAGGG